MAIAFVLGVALFGCKKDTPETPFPEITNDNVEVTATSATFTWTVKWVGKRISIVELSEHEDMSNSQFYGSEEEVTKTNFTVTADDLQPATKYYYRFWVWNQNYESNRFEKEKKSFTTDTDLPKVTTLPVSEVTWTTAKVGGDVTDDCGSEVTERGVCWSENPNPTIGGQHLASGSGTGNFTVQMEDLEPNKTYYVRAYAKNEKGVGYGEDESFITDETLLPEVATAEVTEIGWRTAIGGGEVISENGAMVTERGVCWATTHNPDISNDHANSGTGLGSFTVNMSSLTAGTVYYVRAYAKNNAGVNYGNEVHFTTLDAVAPIVTTAAVTSISYTKATGGGDVTSDGGSNVSKRGICWSKTPNPTYSGTGCYHLTIGSGEGNFSGLMEGLDDNTTYYVCAYAMNGVDFSYGDQVTFQTREIMAPTVTTTSITSIEWTEAIGKGKVTNTGGTEIIERGFCWSVTNEYPTIEDSHAVTTSTTSTFNVSMTNLEPGTAYHARAYAKNSKKIGYGEVMPFTTKALAVPTVTTEEVTNIKQRSAKGNGKVVSNGGLEVIEKGFCWGLDPNPDFENAYVVSNSALSSFSAIMEELEINTSYHVRAYAKNSEGTGWGGDKIFSTLPMQAPTVIINDYSHTSFNAIFNCTVLNDGGNEVREYGICWTTDSGHAPTIDDEKKIATGTGSTYSVQMTGLEPNTYYYVCAYAINDIDVGYSPRSIVLTYPEYFDYLTYEYWYCNVVENGENLDMWISVDDDGTIEYEVESNNGNWATAIGTCSVIGETIYADYEEVYVKDQGTYHGFTHGVEVYVNYQVISCTPNELVIEESLENKTRHFHPEMKQKPSKKRHSRTTKE
jgi:hypothetical protein